VIVAEAMSRIDLLKIFPRLRDGSHVLDSRVHQVRARHVRIEQSDCGATLPVAFADGARVGTVPLDVSVEPQAVEILGAQVA